MEVFGGVILLLVCIYVLVNVVIGVIIGGYEVKVGFVLVWVVVLCVSNLGMVVFVCIWVMWL